MKIMYMVITYTYTLGRYIFDVNGDTTTNEQMHHLTQANGGHRLCTLEPAVKVGGNWLSIISHAYTHRNINIYVHIHHTVHKTQRKRCFTPTELSKEQKTSTTQTVGM